MVRRLISPHPIGLPPQVRPRPLRLVHPDNLTPVRSNHTSVDIPPTPHRIRRSQRIYDLENTDINETAQILFPDLKDEDDEQENIEIVPSYQERSREREFNRMLRESQYVNFEVRERRRINREKRNKDNRDQQMPYMGLKMIAHMYAKSAEIHHKKDYNIRKAVELYELAYILDPESSSLGDVGVMYEELHQYENATKWYERAVKMGCVVSMFNFADMYDKLSKKSYLDEAERNNAYKNMIKYYQMGADLKDNACLAKLLIKCYVKVTNEPGKIIDDKQEHLEMEIMLYTYYAEMLKRQSCACEGWEVCECDLFNIYDLEKDLDESEFEFYNELMNDNTELSVINKCEKIVTTMKDINDTQVFELNSVTKYLKNREDYSVFRNKLALFTKLNHVVDCPICYETKVNIDLRCAHTFCVDCYTKIYATSCPICRCPCNKD